MEDLIRQLEAMGYSPSREHLAPHGFLTIRFHVTTGRFAGTDVDLAFLAKDFPKTPPAGFHVRPGLLPVGQRNIHNSQLGTDWHYWSRRLPDWGKDRSARHIISYVNKVFVDA